MSTASPSPLWGGSGRGSLRVGVLGATGIAGQQVLAALREHPWFTVAAVGTSSVSAGQSLGEALRDPSGGSRWFADGLPDSQILSLRCLSDEDLLAHPIDLLFSAVSKEVAQQWEPRFAERVPVISTASAFRYEPDVPILIPGINDAHAEALHDQRRKRGWHGFIAPIPNCTTTGLAVSLKPLHDAFGVRAVTMTSLQAVSGAGRQGGVLALDVIDNVIPFIPGEEEKVAIETRKILGHWEDPAPFAVSCTCTRVNVQDGHTESVFVGTERPADAAAATAAMEHFAADGLRGLPTAPERLLRVDPDPFRPQPRRDRDAGGGMTVTIGRVRDEPVLEGVKYVVLSHNTKLGAGKGAVLLAEWLTREGYVDRIS
ncbi:MAG TPA: aspartate-semialdehyde dehydrogenase [Candidatus Dormibacteraeota bacterium]|nr:aspartate-semialdehyde dehydrogenase [Candidatus Dormibacteraeota bacterium]